MQQPVLADVTCTVTVGLAVTDVTATSITASSATITWQTVDATTSQVFYDTESYCDLYGYVNYTTIDPASVTSHSVSVDGLTAQTTYYYRVKSTAGSLEGISDEYSFTTSSSGGGGGGGGGGTAPGTTFFYDFVDSGGYLMGRVVASSVDSLARLIIPEGTLALNASGNPLLYVSIVEVEEPPDPPPDHIIVGLVYDFGPEGATFDPPITLLIFYDPAAIPEGVEEEDMTIAVWDEDTGTWNELASVVDTEDDKISVQVSGFSIYTILLPYTPASFSVLNISVAPGQVDVNQPVTITVTVSNDSSASGTYQAELLINGEVEDVQEVTLDGGESTTISFEVIRSIAGSYSVSIDGLSGTFLVEEEEAIGPEPEPEPKPEPDPVPEPEPAPAPVADIVSSSLTATPAVEFGETVIIKVLVINQGDGEGSYEVTLVIDGKVMESRTVTLAGKTEQMVTFTTIAETTGVHTVEVDDLSTIFGVWGAGEMPEVPSELNWLLIGVILGGCAVVTAVIAIYLLKRHAA